MDGGWQDRIDCELRTLRRAETREQLSMEDQLLRAGHLEQQAVSGQPVQGAQVQYCRSTRSRILGGWWRTCCASLGAVLLAVAAGAGRRTSASSALKTAHRLVPEQMQPEGAHHDTAGQ